jgi:hypothetical protein
MRVLILSTLCWSALHAQALVEAAVATAPSSAAANGAAAVGKATKGVFTNLDKVLKSAPGASSTSSTSASSTTTTIGPAAPSKPAPPAKIYEDIKKVEVGLAYDELVERFGPPALEIAGTDGARKLTYSGKQGSTEIEVKDGKVTSITAVKQQSAVFTLPGK